MKTYKIKYHSEASLNGKTQLKLLDIPNDKLCRKTGLNQILNLLQAANLAISSRHFQYFVVYTGPDFNPDAFTHVDTNNHKFSNSKK